MKNMTLLQSFALKYARRPGPDMALRIGLSALLLFHLCACAPKPKTNNDQDGLRAAGYSPSPQISSILAEGPDIWVVSGHADPNGRVRFLYGIPPRAIGITADGNGQFSAPLPASVSGSIYDVSMEDNGRLMQAEGRLFVPPGHADHAVLLRPGAPSQALFNTHQTLAVVDYDSRGALAVSGRVAPNRVVIISAEGEPLARTQSDSRGFYQGLTAIAAAGLDRPLKLTIQEGTKVESRVVVLATRETARATSDSVTPIEGGWKVDWAIPGGGYQTALVF